MVARRVVLNLLGMDREARPSQKVAVLKKGDSIGVEAINMGNIHADSVNSDYLLVKESCPWQVFPYRLISWWDMEKFSAEAFYQIGKVLERISNLLDFTPPPGDAAFSFRPTESIPLTANERSVLKQELEKAIPWCEGIRLELTLKHLSRVVSNLSQQPTRGRFKEDIRELDSRIHDEMENCLFMHIPQEKANYYREPFRGWEEAVERFRETRQDVEEANKSFACGFYSASVFHAMQIVEFGVIEIGRRIGASDPKPGWNSTITKMDKIVNKTKYSDLSPAQQKYRPLLGQLLPIMQSMDDGWRNKISHADNKLVLMTSDFSDKVAEEILMNVRSFMRRLATDLSCEALADAGKKLD